ncbi:MAG: hypothetical protein LW720_10475 [Pirellula sp.]|nr:hypothetical protein [Pirellula sp.]
MSVEQLSSIVRRTANLFDRIHEPENLRMAFHKAARGRRGQAVVRQFAAGLDDRIAEMAKAISEGTIPVGRFQQFLIRDPKERVITAPCFDERVLHHAIMNVCEPVLDRWLIDDTFACRLGKGREAAVLRAQHFTRPALQNILEKSVRELGAIRLIDLRIGVPGQLARNPRVILGDSGQQSDLHRFNFAFCWSISGFTPYIQTSIEPVVRLVVTSVGLMTPTLML